MRMRERRRLVGWLVIVDDSPMSRIMDLPKENINQELSW